MTDQSELCEVQLRDNAGEIQNERRHPVPARPGAIAVTMTAKVGRDDIKMISQFDTYPVPASRLIANAVNQNDRGRSGIAARDDLQTASIDREME